MADVIKKVNEMSYGIKYSFLVNDPKYKGIRNNLKLFAYQYADFKNGSVDNVDEMFSLLIDSIDELLQEVELNLAQPISLESFKSTIEGEFFKFMVEKKCLSQKTAKDYVNRVKQIGDIEELATMDVNPIIEKYTVGEMRELNKRLHNAPSSALKKFREFKEEELHD